VWRHRLGGHSPNVSDEWGVARRWRHSGGLGRQKLSSRPPTGRTVCGNSWAPPGSSVRMPQPGFGSRWPNRMCLDEDGRWQARPGCLADAPRHSRNGHHVPWPPFPWAAAPTAAVTR